MADPMTPEDERRIAELLAMHPALLQPEAIELRAEVERLQGWLGDYKATQARNAELKAEVEQLQAKVAKDHDELRDKRSDLLNVRGILSPQPSVGDRVVPMPLGAEVAPAVEWLAAEVKQLRARLEAAWAVVREGTANMRAQLATVRAERDEARTAQQRSDELLVGAHNDLCEALGVRHRPLLDVIQHAATIRAERDSLAEQVKRSTDLKLIRLAISDPGAFVKRERFNDDDRETIPAWGARAVVLALQEGGEGRG